MSQLYTNVKLKTIAGENYQVMLHYCSILEQEGYWVKPSKILHQTIYELLEIYVQALLVQQVITIDHINEEQKDFITGLSGNDLFGICGEKEMICSSHAAQTVDSPPILLQLFGLRDIQKQSSMQGLFFDALLNIMLAFAFLNQLTTLQVSHFIQNYYQKVKAFLNTNKSVDEKYIFKKLCFCELESTSRQLLKAGEDFESYKEKNFYSIRTVSNKVMEKEDSILETERIQEYEELIPEQEKTGYFDCLQAEDFMEEREETTDFEISERTPFVNEKSKLDTLLEELNSLIGLDTVKKEMTSLVNLIKVVKLRKKYFLPSMEMSYHMVFTGNPGTGKTTVARLIASIYRELGLVRTGIFIETDRSGLVAGYVGQTALKVKEVIERAVGGVLFIDEAYALSESNQSNDFGGEAIDTLVKMMEDHRDNLIVIVAGYTEEMKRFLKSNPGLVSRFNRFIDFPDYSNYELIEILKAVANKNGIIIEKPAVQIIKEALEQMSEKTKIEFGNARGIRNLFEQLIVNQANRLVRIADPTREQLTTMIEEDIIMIKNIGLGDERI